MKRFRHIGEFALVFLIVLTFFYMKPVVLSKNNPKPVDELVVNEIKPQTTNSHHNDLNATGMSALIGLTEKELIEKLNNPKKEWQIGPNRKWLVYGDNQKDYYQVEILDGKVLSIFVLGTQVDIAPFNMDMTLSDISEITTIYPNFEFEYNNNKYEIELTEDDMNYRPLVSFDNGTFALLHFDSKNGKLIGVRYVDKMTLVETIPYQLNDEQPPVPLEMTDEEKEKYTNAQTDQLYTILNVIRERMNRKTYTIDPELSIVSKKALDEFNKAPNSVIKKEDRFEQWKEKVESSNPSDSFILTDDEMTRLIKLGNPSNKKTHGLFVQSRGDVPFIVTNWFVNRFEQKEMTDATDAYIGISFNKNQVLVLFNPTKSEDSYTVESSEIN